MKKLNKIILMSLVVLFVMPMFNSCRKGENDPGISFRSRDGRLMQEWKLIKVEGSEQYQDWENNVVILTYSYDGSIYTVSGGGQSSSMTGSFEIEFQELGKVYIKETLSGQGVTDVYSGTGTWQWLDSDKSQNYLLTNGGQMFGGGLYYVDRLAKKEMVLKQSYDENDNGDIAKGEFTYIFEPK